MMNFLESMQAPAADATPVSSTVKVPLKTLYDHGHNVRNKMVIYDDDPRIEAVMKQALDRHGNQLKEHEDFIKKTREKQLEINETASRHSELKKHEVEKHRDEMRQVLEQQVLHKHKLKNHDQNQRRQLYATHFGPEPEDDLIKRHRHLEKTTIYKESLLNQIKSQEISAKEQVEMERAFENLVVDSHNLRLQEEEARKAQKERDQKAQFREAWQHQMRVNQEKRAGGNTKA
jgi:hypothetical protein